MDEYKAAIPYAKVQIYKDKESCEKFYLKQRPMKKEDLKLRISLRENT